jgi:ABC-type Zn uptake system ZnuABC Zn-binding protein ZnuA
LANEKFVAAKPDLADEIRNGLQQAESQLATIAESLQKMIAKL